MDVAVILHLNILLLRYEYSTSIVVLLCCWNTKSGDREYHARYLQCKKLHVKVYEYFIPCEGGTAASNVTGIKALALCEAGTRY